MPKKAKSNIVKIGLVQMSCDQKPKANLKKAIVRMEEAAKQGAQIVCLQELFRSQYFCQTEDITLFKLAETIPGPTTDALSKVARQRKVVIVASIFEKRAAGVYHNTVVVIDADGSYLGKYRKNHIPHCPPGFWEKFYFRPGNLGYPVFKTQYADIGVYICYDRHFPEGARALGLNGAEIVFNPSATSRAATCW